MLQPYTCAMVKVIWSIIDASLDENENNFVYIISLARPSPNKTFYWFYILEKVSTTKSWICIIKRYVFILYCYWIKYQLILNDTEGFPRKSPTIVNQPIMLQIYRWDWFARRGLMWSPGDGNRVKTECNHYLMWNFCWKSSDLIDWNMRLLRLNACWLLCSEDVSNPGKMKTTTVNKYMQPIT